MRLGPWSGGARWMAAAPEAAASILSRYASPRVTRIDATGTARARGRTGVGTWVALKYRVPAAATSMSRNGMARGYCTIWPWSWMRTMEARAAALHIQG